MDIDLLLFDGFDELDVVGPFEVLASARDLGAPFSVALAGVHGREPVTAAHGMRILPDHAAGDRRPDLLVVPGGGWNTRGPLGARAEVERGVLPAKLAEWHAGGIAVATVCTGALIAGAGLEGPSAAAAHFALLWGGDVMLYKSLGIAAWPWQWSLAELALLHKGSTPPPRALRTTA